MRNLFMLFYTILSLAAYFYFNRCYFTLVEELRGLVRKSSWAVTGIFIINFILFTICTYCEWNLIWNWAAFFVFLFVETFIYCKGGWKESAFFSLIGILCGLTVNIFCRCVIAIIIAQPLSNFDNNVTNTENLKGIPVCLGFLLGGIVFRTLTKPEPGKNIRILLGHPEHLAFILKVMSGMFGYLFLNLLIYKAEDNGFLLKLWGIKSCIFVAFGTFMGIRFAQQMCVLDDYRKRNRQIKQEVLQKYGEEEKLRTEAYHDILTRCFNRQYAENAIEKLLEDRRQFVLCFADLNGLKQVNDRFGHGAGDRYLIAAAGALENVCRQEEDVLARYGGDEFLVILPDTSVSEISERLQTVNEKLEEQRKTGHFPFPMSVCFGVADSRESNEMKELIRLADQKMYGEKSSYRKDM